MKKICFFLLFMLFASASFSQAWVRNLPSDKSKGELTLFDYRNAFETYWAPYNVDKGFYLENGVKKKAMGWKQFKRWEYEMESKVNPATGEFPKQTAEEIYKAYLKAHPQLKSPVSANWTQLGPDTSLGGYNGIGRINCIAFHPADLNTYWVGTAAGGLWVTINNGSSWSCLTNNNGVLAVSDIVIPADYATSNTIYIATGDKDHWDNRSIGVLKSTDGGSTWNATGIAFDISDGKMVNRILLDPNNNQNLIAATTNGVYITTNGGTTWNTQLTATDFIDMEFKPGDFNTLYGSTKTGQIYLSANGGGTWTQAFTNSSAYRIELAVTPIQPTWVYAIAVNSGSGLYGIYKSTNSGAAYTQVFSGTTLNLLGWSSNGGDSGGQGWYDLSLAVSPSNANILLVGGVNTWRSLSGGASWSIVNHWWGDGVPAVHADKHNLSFRSNGDLFETNDGGVYFSSNNGTGWADKTNGIVISQMYKLSVSATVSNEVITGLQDNGTKLLSGGSWEDVKGGDGMECLIDYTNVNVQYGTYVNGQIDRTTNHWATANAIQPSGAGNGAWVTPYIIDPDNAQTLYAGYADIWKTTNRGTSWVKISTMNTSNKIRSMAIAPSNTQVLYVANQTTLWKTINGGTGWTDITGTLPVSSGSITYVTVKEDDENTIWVTLGGYNNNNLYQSADGGTSWINISSGLPQIPAYAVVQNKQSTAEVQLYAGTELGVYFKKGSDNWVPYSTGLPNVKIGEVEIYYASSPQNSILRAATFGRGLWETPVYYTCTAPSAPVVGTITQPTCTEATGSVVLEGLPVSGIWIINPGGITGAGSTITIAGLAEGTYNFTVTSAENCTSLPSENVVINAQPVTPLAPVAGTINQPSCTTATGSVVLTGLPSSGTWTINPGSITGTGTETIISGLISGTYQFTVTSEEGCTSVASADVVINPQPLTPPTPAITQNGFVLHSDAPAGNQWYDQNGLIAGETNQNYTVTANGDFHVIVTLEVCSSEPSNIITITNVGIGSVANNGKINVFPNPVSGELMIEITGNLQNIRFEIVSSTGNTVFKGNLSDRTVVKTTGFTPGLYMIKFENGRSFEFRKIVKK
ncbi:MAG: T9SS type A sorting domain-containing protein [Bacteroidota bacterium]